MIVLETPIRARLIGYEGRKKELQKFLSYVDGRVDFELSKTTRSLSKFSNSETYFREKMGDQKYDSLLLDLQTKKEELKLKRKGCLLFEDEKGFWTYSGLAHKIAEKYADEVRPGYDLPPAKNLPWAHEPEFQDRPYQVEALTKLMGSAPWGPCGVELPTGAGKSTIIRNLIKTFGLGTVVMAPSASIARQLYEDLVHHFGDRYVGLYGDGKKDFKKLVVVGIDDSLRNVVEGSAAWKMLSTKPVFIADESHLTPAESLQKVCFGLMAGATHRFFFSATQLRNDGLDLVLDAITGRIVMRKLFRELVDDGYLAKPTFKSVKVVSDSGYQSPDANKMTRAHLYYNDTVNYVAADLANKFVEVMKRPTLILVEELEQFRELLPWLKVKVRFAHSPLSKEKWGLVPCDQEFPCLYEWTCDGCGDTKSEGERFVKHKCRGCGRINDAALNPEERTSTCCYHGDDAKDLVAAFNRGEIPVLVGTSCISTGTDIKVAEAGIYLQGGRSEIKVKQGLAGRMSRGGAKSVVVNPWTKKQKLDAVVVDFDVVNVDKTHDHHEVRAQICTSLYKAPQPINYTQVMVPKKPRIKP